MAEDGGESNQDEKTEDPSQARRDQLRDEGQVVQSREVAAAIVLLSTAGALWGAGQWSLRGIWTVFETTLGDLPKLGLGNMTIPMVMSAAGWMMKALVMILAPVALAALIAGIFSSVAQIGFVWSTKPMELDLDKLNPSHRLGKIFSMDGLFEFAKALVKFIVIGAVLYSILSGWIKESGGIFGLEVREIASYLGAHIIRIVFSLGLGMAILAGIDYGFQKFRYEQRIKMTKQEARQERKQQEGDPFIRSRIKGIQRSLAKARMIEAVRSADVVITNPTHIAVAIKYDRDNMAAPRVVAKGADFMAEQIKKIAREHGIPTVENVPLARAMYKALKVGQTISRDLYNAVAEVLAYVYRLKGKVQ